MFMKKFWNNRKRQFLTGLALIMGATMILNATVLAQQCYQIRNSVVRLHIIAHSDNSRDQLVKLKVRDALLTQGKELFAGAKTKEEALQLTQENLAQLTQIAQQTVKQSRQSHAVSCQIESGYFNTRTYNTVTLPAGNYMALRVVIGAGEGKNWWCVMFPPLCVPAAGEVQTKEQAIEQVLTPGQTDLVENGKKYEIRFKTVELVQSVIHQCREWWEQK